MADASLAPSRTASGGMSSLRAWVLASRPATLSAAIVPVAVGSACAAVLGGLRVGPALAALAGAMLIQIGTNFANDVFDFEKGADDEARLGPTRAVSAGLITPRAMRVGMVVAFGLAALAGVYLALVAGWVVIAIGVASIASGIAYTGGPFPLGYHGLGDVFVLVFFGFVAVCGTVFVQMGTVPPLALWSAVPVGALATAILVVNNLRDRHGDAQAGKRTLAVRLGRRGALAELALLLVASYAVPPLLFARGEASVAVLAPLATAPLAVALFRRVARDEGAALNRSLGASARLLLVFGVTFAAALAAGAVLR